MPTEGTCNAHRREIVTLKFSFRKKPLRLCIRFMWLRRMMSDGML